MGVTTEISGSKLALKECEIKEAELCFVTSIDRSTKTFFAQLCKNSNEDLITFNYEVCKYCYSIVADRNAGEKKKARPKEINAGDVLCAKYPSDEQWYRATILSVDKVAKKCVVRYLDYGNTETVTFRQLIEVNPNDFPTITREPFGVICSFLDEPKDDQEWTRLFNALEKKYLLLKMKDPQKDGTWKVTIPKHGYNVPYWRAFKPELYPNKVRSRDQASMDKEE